MKITPCLYVLLISTCLTSCATFSRMFINEDGQIMQCSATGQGIVGMGVASNAERSCEDNLRAAGYIELEKAGVIGIEFSETKNDTVVKVLKVYNPSPADSAGIKPGPTG